MKGWTRILGIGSPFGDDRVGWLAAEMVRVSAWYRSLAAAVQVESLDRPGPGLLAAMQGASHVVLVDAMRSGEPPGTIRRVDLDRVGVSSDKLVSVHGFDLADTLALGNALGLLPSRLTLFAVEAKHTLADEDLSVEVRAALPMLVRRVQASVAGSLAAETMPT